jgi:hypothetical protein
VREGEGEGRAGERTGLQVAGPERPSALPLEPGKLAHAETESERERERERKRPKSSSWGRGYERGRSLRAELGVLTLTTTGRVPSGLLQPIASMESVFFLHSFLQQRLLHITAM